jgi:hypothetical protein
MKPAAKVPDKFELSAYELNQPGIIKLVAYLEDRLVKHRVANDSFSADPSLRGRIAELKILLKALKVTDETIIGISNPNLRK